MTQTATDTILDELLNMYYHAIVTKDIKRDPKVVVDRLMVLATDLGGMKETMEARRASLENFNRELQGNLRQRCEISAVHLECLQKALS
jgi:hypothetical protein